MAYIKYELFARDLFDMLLLLSTMAHVKYEMFDFDKDLLDMLLLTWLMLNLSCNMYGINNFIRKQGEKNYLLLILRRCLLSPTNVN